MIILGRWEQPVTESRCWQHWCQSTNMMDLNAVQSHNGRILSGLLGWTAAVQAATNVRHHLCVDGARRQRSKWRNKTGMIFDTQRDSAGAKPRHGLKRCAPDSQEASAVISIAWSLIDHQSRLKLNLVFDLIFFSTHTKNGSRLRTAPHPGRSKHTATKRSRTTVSHYSSRSHPLIRSTHCCSWCNQLSKTVTDGVRNPMIIVMK